MENMYIYYVEAIYLKEKTKEDLDLEFKIRNLRYAKQMTFEEFLNFKKNWHEDKYNINSFISSYHNKFEDAKKYIENNIGDINEAGVYNYGAICKVPLNKSYYNSNLKEEDIIIYKYNKEMDSYEELNKNVPEYKYLIEYIMQIISFK